MYSSLQEKSSVYSRNLSEDRKKSIEQFSENDFNIFRSLPTLATNLVREFGYEI